MHFFKFGDKGSALIINCRGSQITRSRGDVVLCVLCLATPFTLPKGSRKPLKRLSVETAREASALARTARCLQRVLQSGPQETHSWIRQDVHTETHPGSHSCGRVIQDEEQNISDTRELLLNYKRWLKGNVKSSLGFTASSSVLSFYLFDPF